MFMWVNSGDLSMRLLWTTLGRPIEPGCNKLEVVVDHFWHSDIRHRCHSAFHELGSSLLSQCSPAAYFALFCLADSLGHGNSFPGGIGKLKEMASARCSKLIGSVPSGI